MGHAFYFAHVELQPFSLRSLLVQLGIFSLAFSLYLVTMAPGLMQTDTGELAAVQILFGIPHATGYPLFLVLGWLWQQLPLPFSAVYKANLLAGIYTAAAAAVLYSAFSFSIRLWLAPPVSPKKPLAPAPEPVIAGGGKAGKSGKYGKHAAEQATPVAAAAPVTAAPSPALSATAVALLAATGALTAASCATFWAQGTSTEVYSLHLLCLSLILRQALLCLHQPGSNRRWLWLAGLLGLGFTNHMSTILVLPALAWLYFSTRKFNKAMLVQLGLMAAVGMAIIVPLYLVLVIRAGQYPVLSWGHVTSWQAFKYHVTGKQFQVWVFSGSDVFKKQLGHFFSTLADNHNLAVLALALVGLVVSFRHKGLAWLWLIWLGFTVFFSANYNIHDIDSYFLLAYVSIAAFAVLAAAWLVQKASPRLRSAAAAAFLLFPFLNVVEFYEKQDLTQVSTFDQYTQAILDGAPPRAIILSRQWDYFISPSYYHQFVEGRRKDVLVIDRELLRRSWYYPQIERMDPDAFRPVVKPAADFVRLVEPFEQDRRFDAAALQNAYIAVTQAYIGQHNSRPVLLTTELVQEELLANKEIVLPAGQTLIPYNLAFLMVPNNNQYVPDNSPNIEINYALADKNDYISNIKLNHYNMLINRAFYELDHGKLAQAKAVRDKMLTLYPDKQLPKELTGL